MLLPTDAARLPTILNWTWLPESREVILGLISETTAAPREDAEKQMREANTLADSKAWFLSVFVSARDRMARALATSPGRSLRVIAVSTTDGSTRELATEADARYASGTWLLTANRRHLLFGVQDARISANSQVRQHQMYLLAREDERSFSFRDARSGLRAIDLGSGAVSSVYATPSTSTIVAIAQLARARDTLLTVENDPSFSVWPTAGTFGTVRLAQQNGTASVLLPEVVVPSAFYGSDRSNVIYQCEGSSPEKRVFEIGLSTGTRSQISPHDLSATDCDVSEDGSTIVAVLEGVNTPPDLHVWTTTARQWRRVTNYADRVDPAMTSGITRLTWRSKDNRFDLEGFLVCPQRATTGIKEPLLVWLHGAIGGDVPNEFDPLFGVAGFPARVFASEGYCVLMPMWRGDRGRTLEFSRAVLGHVEDSYNLDIDAGVDHLVAIGRVDPDKLGILAHSGGARQLSYAISHTSRYKAAVNNDGPDILPELSLPENATWTAVPDGAPIVPEGLLAYYGFDPVRRPFADPYDIRTPLLLRWSNLVAPSRASEQQDVYGLRWEYRFHALPQSKRLAHALRQTGVPFEVMIDNDEHWLVDFAYILEYQSRLLQWFDYYVLGKDENLVPAMKGPSPP